MPRTPRQHGTAAMYSRGPSSLPDPAYVPADYRSVPVRSVIIDRRAGQVLEVTTFAVAPGCRCAPCRKASTQRAQRDTYLRETGRSRYVDAAPARAHVQLLLDAGMTRHQVAGLTGGVVDRTQVRALMVGQNGKGPSRRIRRITEAALLAVPVVPAAAAVPDQGTLPAIGTVRRLQALLAAGYRLSFLCRELGVLPSNGAQLLTRQRVTAATARKVRDLYDRLEQHPGDPKVAAVYQARGFLHPGWWDPSTIDDPAHKPAVDVPGGRLDRLDRQAERREVVAELIERGLSVSKVVHELHQQELIDPDVSHEAAQRQVERDKAWWRSRGRRLPVAA